MKDKKRYLIGIYCLSMMTMAVMIVSPTLELTQREFPNASSIAIQYITALPTLFAIPSALCTGWLSKKIGARTVAMISYATYVVTALGVIFARSITAVLVWRAVNGIAIGLTACSMIFQVQLFTPEERRTVSGRTAFVSNTMGLVFGVASGFISSMLGWRASYWIYVVLCVPAIFIIRAMLPSKAEMEQKMAAQIARMAQRPPGQGGRSGAGFNWGFWWSLFLIVLCFICIGVMTSNVAMHVVGRGIGTSATVGIVMMVNTAAAAVVGFFYDKLSVRTRRWNYTIGPFIMGTGLLIGANATSLGMMLGAQLITGTGWGYVLTESRLLIFGTTEPANRATGLSMMSATMNFGQFISPMIAVPIARLIFGDTPRDRFLLASCIMFLVGTLYAFIDPKKAVKFEEV